MIKKILSLLFIIPFSVIIVLVIFNIYFVCGRKLNPTAKVKMDMDKVESIEDITAEKIDLYSPYLNAFWLYAEDEMVLSSPNMLVYAYGADGETFPMQGNYEVHMMPSLEDFFFVSVLTSGEWVTVKDPERISEYASAESDIELYSKYGGSISHQPNELFAPDTSSEQAVSENSTFFKRLGSAAVYSYDILADSDDETLSIESHMFFSAPDKLEINPVKKIELYDAEKWIASGFGCKTYITKPDNAEFGEEDGVVSEGMTKIGISSVFGIDRDDNSSCTEVSVSGGDKEATCYVYTSIAGELNGNIKNVTSIKAKATGSLSFIYGDEPIEHKVTNEEVSIHAEELFDCTYQADYKTFGFNYEGNVDEARISEEDLYPSIGRWYRNETYSFLACILAVGASIAAILNFGISYIKYMHERSY